MSLEPTPLETALLEEFHRLYGERGFPAPEAVRLLRRENTGAGRFVHLGVEDEMTREEGPLDLGGHYIEMKGVPYGLMALVHVRDRRPEYLEIVVYGNEGWDGVERAWSLV